MYRRRNLSVNVYLWVLWVRRRSNVCTGERAVPSPGSGQQSNRTSNLHVNRSLERSHNNLTPNRNSKPNVVQPSRNQWESDYWWRNWFWRNWLIILHNKSWSCSALYVLRRKAWHVTFSVFRLEKAKVSTPSSKKKCLDTLDQTMVEPNRGHDFSINFVEQMKWDLLEI